MHLQLTLLLLMSSGNTEAETLALQLTRGTIGQPREYWGVTEAHLGCILGIQMEIWVTLRLTIEALEKDLGPTKQAIEGYPVWTEGSGHPAWHWEDPLPEQWGSWAENKGIWPEANGFWVDYKGPFKGNWEQLKCPVFWRVLAFAKDDACKFFWVQMFFRKSYLNRQSKNCRGVLTFLYHPCKHKYTTLQLPLAICIG